MCTKMCTKNYLNLGYYEYIIYIKLQEIQRKLFSIR